MDTNKGPGRPKIGKRTVTIALNDEITDFIDSERELAKQMIGAAPSEQDLIRNLLLRAKALIEAQREEPKHA